MITFVPGSTALIDRRASTPLTPGITISMRIASKGVVLASEIASSPDRAISTRYCLAVRISARVSTAPTSSSTIRTEGGDMSLTLSARLAKARQEAAGEGARHSSRHGGCPPRSSSRAIALPSCPPLSAKGQQQREGRPSPRAAPEADRPAVVLHDLVGEGQPQAGAAGLRREERVEDLPGRGGRNPPPGILDLHLQAALVQAGRTPAHEIGPLTPARPERQTTSALHCVQRVSHQVDQGAVEMLGVGLYRREPAGVLPDGGHPLRLDLPRVEFQHPVQQLRHVARPEAQERGARQLQEPLPDRVDPPPPP